MKTATSSLRSKLYVRYHAWSLLFFSVQPINSYDIQYKTVAGRDAFLEVELAVSLTFPFHFFRAAASLSLGLVLMIYM